MIQFVGSGQIKDLFQNIRNKKMYWGSTFIKATFKSEDGYIRTIKGTRVPANRYVQGSLGLEIIDAATNRTIPQTPHFFDQFNFDFTYNCFGYCFAESK